MVNINIFKIHSKRQGRVTQVLSPVTTQIRASAPTIPVTVQTQGSLNKSLSPLALSSLTFFASLAGLTKTLSPLTLSSVIQLKNSGGFNKSLSSLAITSTGKLKIKATLSRLLSNTILNSLGSTSATVAYDTAIGASVDTNGFTSLPLRSGANRYFVGAGGNDSNTGLSHAQRFATLDKAVSLLTAGNGDQILIAEGTTLAETLPQSGDPHGWVATWPGYSALYPTVYSSYDPADPTNEAKIGMGHQRNARPVLTRNTGQVSNFSFGYIAVKGLDFNAGNVSNVGINFIGYGHHILVENCLLRYQTLSFDTTDAATVFPTTQKIIVRNNAIYGAWSTGGITGGVYCAGYDGPTLEDNIFYHCGWKIGGNRDDDISIGGASVFQHSYYIQTNTTNAIIRRNLSMDPGGDGGTPRGDSTLYENLYVDCPNAMSLGGGPEYNTERPSGVSIQAHHNAVLGSSVVTSTHPLGWGTTTSNGFSGSSVHHNLYVRNTEISAGNATTFSNVAQDTDGNGSAPPSYMNFDSNVAYLWTPSGNTYFTQTDGFASQVHTTYTNNIWDDAASGSNTQSSAGLFPNPYTAASLYTALGYADKAAFVADVIARPEAHIQRTARSLLFAGYGMS